MVKEEFEELVGAGVLKEVFSRIDWVYENTGIFDGIQQLANVCKAEGFHLVEKIFQELHPLYNEVASLQAGAAARQEPLSPAEISDDLISDLAVFLEDYCEEIRMAVILSAGRIAKNNTLVQLLHEYAVRKKKEREEYFRRVAETANGKTYSASNNCLTHAQSYRDVIYDLLRPYWNEG